MSSHRIVFDTNIFLSALLFGGKPLLVFEMARAGKILLVTAPSILAEFASILGNKFGWADENIRDAIRTIGRRAELVKPSKRLHVLKDDADNRVLECALEGKADYIISGDHHLLDLGEFQEIPILSAADFLKKQTRS